MSIVKGAADLAVPVDEPGNGQCRAPRYRTALAPVLFLSVVTGFALLLPHIVGVGWSRIGHTLGAVSPTTVLALVALWFAGVLAHLPVLTRSLPGLSRRRALSLNLAGGSVAALFPFGGTAGIGVGLAMARSWGFDNGEFASFAVLSNLCNVLGRLIFSVGLLAVATAFGTHLPASTTVVVQTALVFVATVTVAVAASLRTARAAVWCDSMIERSRRRLRIRAARPSRDGLVLGCRDQLLASLRCWPILLSAMIAHLTLQGALLGACVGAVGGRLPILAICVVFALDRLVSLVPFTPAAVGIAEITGIAGLHAFGVPLVQATSAVLLYRMLLVGLTVQLGGVVLLAWARRRGPRDERA